MALWHYSIMAPCVSLSALDKPALLTICLPPVVSIVQLGQTKPALQGFPLFPILRVLIPSLGHVLKNSSKHWSHRVLGLPTRLFAVCGLHQYGNCVQRLSTSRAT